MQVSSSELEHIVRVVMQRLAVGRDLMAGVAEMADIAHEASELALSERLVTTQLLEGRLDNKRVLRVAPRAIVTPAVMDLLKAKNIEIVRGSAAPSRPQNRQAASNLAAHAPKTRTTAGASAASTAQPTTKELSATLAPTLVCGSAVWFGSLARHLCPKQAAVESCDDTRALMLTQEHLNRGGKRVIWLTSAPFAAAAAAQRSAQTIAVQLPALSDLAAAQEQAHPQILIIDVQRWTVAAIGNLVRTLARSS